MKVSLLLVAFLIGCWPPRFGTTYQAIPGPTLTPPSGSGQRVPFVYFQSLNDLDKTVYPLVTNGGNCWATPQNEIPLPASSYSFVHPLQFNAARCKDYSQPYKVLWGSKNPPKSGCTIIVTYQPYITRTPYAFQVIGKSLSCKLVQYTTQGGLGVQLITIESEGLKNW